MESRSEKPPNVHAYHVDLKSPYEAYRGIAHIFEDGMTMLHNAVLVPPTTLEGAFASDTYNKWYYFAGGRFVVLFLRVLITIFMPFVLLFSTIVWSRLLETSESHREIERILEIKLEGHDDKEILTIDSLQHHLNVDTSLKCHRSGVYRFFMVSDEIENILQQSEGDLRSKFRTNRVTSITYEKPLYGSIWRPKNLKRLVAAFDLTIVSLCYFNYGLFVTSFLAVPWYFLLFPLHLYDQ